MFANLVKGLISATFLVSLVGCFGSDSENSSTNKFQTYEYALEGNAKTIWTPSTVSEVSELPGDSWFIKWNEENGEITGVFEGPWGRVHILGTNDGTYREIHGVPTSPLDPLGADRVEFAFDGGELSETVTVAFVAYKDEQVEHTLTIYPSLLAPVIPNAEESKILQSSVFMHQNENVKEL